MPADPAGGRNFSIVPSLSLSETLTDNSRLTSTDKQTDLVTQVTPGIRITSNGGRVKGFLDYSLTGLAYARSSSSNEFQSSLNSVVKVEAIENWAFVDATANISQQSVSAYGTRSTDSTLVNSNRTEVRTLTLSPYLTGKLASFADYDVRLTQNWTRNSATSEADNSSTLATLKSRRRQRPARRELVGRRVAPGVRLQRRSAHRRRHGRAPCCSSRSRPSCG